ncbi:MAG: hypothetical protein LC798_13290 [Chloroflexi bacterium]|nr:hypothetical protein [Chloroflexota bacterium]
MAARVLQVGWGVSTEVMLRAACEHGLALVHVRIKSVPHPLSRRRGRRNEITLLTEGAVDVHAEGVSTGDLLFVDSTHSGKPGARRGFALTTMGRRRVHRARARG